MVLIELTRSAVLVTAKYCGMPGRASPPFLAMMLRMPSAVESAAMPTTKVWMPAAAASVTACSAAASSGPPATLDGQGMQIPDRQHWPPMAMSGAGQVHAPGVPPPEEQLGSPSVARRMYLGL